MRRLGFRPSASGGGSPIPSWEVSGHRAYDRDEKDMGGLDDQVTNLPRKRTKDLFDGQLLLSLLLLLLLARHGLIGVG